MRPMRYADLYTADQNALNRAYARRDNAAAVVRDDPTPATRADLAARQRDLHVLLVRIMDIEL